MSLAQMMSKTRIKSTMQINYGDMEKYKVMPLLTIYNSIYRDQE